MTFATDLIHFSTGCFSTDTNTHMRNIMNPIASKLFCTISFHMSICTRDKQPEKH